MRCLNPFTVGFDTDGKTIIWSPKRYSKEYPIFQLPCSKCIECRLEYARQWAVRCVHESKMHNDNVFITLTYNDANLGDGRLHYDHFQKFIKRLRDLKFRRFLKSYGKENWKLLTKDEKNALYEKEKISVFVTGEYGDKTKRPHWHAILFNYQPSDPRYHYTTENGDRVYTSEELTGLWPFGNSEFGAVTFKSAGYVARYAAKKLVHGRDQDHNFDPISKKSSHQAIGKKFLEKYWRDIFSYGHVILDDGSKTSIPRYYEKWLQKNHPDEWYSYLQNIKLPRMSVAEKREEDYKQEQNKQNLITGRHVISRNKVRYEIIKNRFNILQSYLKGDF